MEWIAALKKLLGEDIISSDSDVLKNYASDYTEDFVFLPHAVATPRTTAQVSDVLAFCNEHNIGITSTAPQCSWDQTCYPIAHPLSRVPYNQATSISHY